MVPMFFLSKRHVFCFSGKTCPFFLHLVDFFPRLLEGKSKNGTLKKRFGKRTDQHLQFIVFLIQKPSGDLGLKRPKLG